VKKAWLSIGALAASPLVSAQTWVPQQSGTKAGLRGIHAVSPRIAWASGDHGTFLKTTDGGANWLAATMPGASDLDFRDVEAFDDRTAFLLSAGAGPLSRLYKTTDGGTRWSLLYTNPDPRGFFDCMGFWDQDHGVILGDPVDGRFTVLVTDDGANWHARKGPPAAKGEGAFAASGTCLVTRGTREAWFATGGPGGGRVFHTLDAGETWSVAKTPLRSGSENAGIFSLAFADARHGIAVGGDYKDSASASGNLAVTEDGGKTWTVPQGAAPGGYRSAVVWSPERKLWIATGTKGSDVSADGRVWTSFDTASYNALSLAGGTGWAVGPGGAIAKLQ
jgi:photosystem II stability/assembly factor-like uncharacterized protein